MELEQRVEVRTAELAQSNESLRAEIVERERVEEALARERANLRAVFDVVNVGMLVIGENGAVKQVNDTLSRWAGRDVLAWEGGQPGDFMGCVHALADPAGCGHGPQCDSCPIRNTFASVLQTGKPIHDVEAEAILSVDGREVRLWLEVSADPLLLDGKRHVILAINNITDASRPKRLCSKPPKELGSLEQGSGAVCRRGFARPPGAAADGERLRATASEEVRESTGCGGQQRSSSTPWTAPSGWRR